MKKLVIAAVGVMFLVGCGKSPVGDWLGVVELAGDDGSTYKNEMTVTKDGHEATLYSVIANPDYDPDDPTSAEYLIAYSTFDGTWEKSGSDIVFQMDCTWDGCDYATAMTCSFDDPGMTCDASPDFYADDGAVLQWEEQ